MWGLLPSALLALVYDGLPAGLVHSSCHYVNHHWRSTHHPQPGRDIVFTPKVCRLWMTRGFQARVISGRDAGISCLPTPLLLSVHVLRSLSLKIYDAAVANAILAWLAQLQSLQSLDLQSSAPCQHFKGVVEFPASLESATLANLKFDDSNAGGHEALRSLVIDNADGVSVFPPNLTRLDWKSGAEFGGQKSWHAALDLEHLENLSCEHSKCLVPTRTSLTKSARLRELRLVCPGPATLRHLPPTLERIDLSLGDLSTVRQTQALPLVVELALRGFFSHELVTACENLSKMSLTGTYADTNITLPSLRELSLCWFGWGEGFVTHFPKLVVLSAQDCGLSVSEVQVFCALPLEKLTIAEIYTREEDHEAALELVRNASHIPTRLAEIGKLKFSC